MTFFQLFGAPLDFQLEEDPTDKTTRDAYSAASFQHEHFELLTQLCEEPQKMLTFWHKVHEDFADDNELKERLAKAREQRVKGNEHFLSDLFVPALKCYREAIELFPNDPVFYTNSCLCNLKLGRFEDAVVDAQGAISCDRTWAKGPGLLMAAYCHLGYQDVVACILENGLSGFGLEYYAEAKKMLSEITRSLPMSKRRSLNNADLVATVKRLFNGGKHAPATYAFLLTHIIRHCELKDVENRLASLDFVRRVLSVPYLTGLLSPTLDVFKLSPEDGVCLSQLLRLLGSVIVSSDNSATPQPIVSFLAGLGPFWTNSSTIRRFSQKIVPCGQLIFDYYCRLLTTVASNKESPTKFLKATSPINRLDWLICLPTVCFGILNPTQRADLYHIIVRFFCLVTSLDWFPEHVSKIPTAELKRSLGIYASFGIVCDRLLDYELPFDTFMIPPARETFYMFWLKFSETKQVAELVLRIPEVWMMFARGLAKNPYDPRENAWALMAMDNFLIPWMWESDRDDDSEEKLEETAVFCRCLEEGPWFDMLLYSIPKLMMPKRKYDDSIISAVGVGAKLSTASQKFAKRLLEMVPLTKFTRFCGYIDDYGAIHYFATMLGTAEESEIAQFVNDSENKRFSDSVTTLILALSSAEEEMYETAADDEIYHACVALHRLLKFASIADESTAKKIRLEISKEMKQFENLSDLFNSLVTWVKRKSPPTGSKAMGKNQRRRNNRKAKQAREEEEEDQLRIRPPVSQELSSRAVHKLFDALERIDGEFSKKIKQIKSKRRNF